MVSATVSALRRRRAATRARERERESESESESGPSVDDVLVSSSSDEREGGGAGGACEARGRVHARSWTGEDEGASEASVMTMMRRAERRREAEALEASREMEGGSSDSGSEDGLVIAAAREARALDGGWEDGGATASTSAREEARRALEALRAREGIKGATGGARSNAASVVELKNVERITDAMMDTVDAGRAVCCALGSGRSVAVGTEGGFIFLERDVNGEPTMSCLRSANNFAGISASPGVTSLCFDDRGEWLLVGHDDGGLTLWDVKRNPTILKTIVGVHRTPVVALVMLPKANPAGVVDVISSEEGGLVIHHTFSPLGMGVIRVKSTSLGERTFVIAAQALPHAAAVSVNDVKDHANGIVSDTFGETADASKSIADMAGIVALCTMNAALIMRLNPRAEVIAKIVRPPNLASSVLPVMCWSPRWAEEVSVHDNMEECKLVVVWGASVYVLAVDVESVKPLPVGTNQERTKRTSNTSKIVHSWKVDSEVSTGALAVAWLARDLICLLSSRNKLLICTPTGDIIDRVSTGEPPVPRELSRGVTGNDAGPDRVQNWHGSVAVHGVHLAILSPSRLRRGKFLGWIERMQAKKREGDWMGAFETLLQVHGHKLPMWPALSKKYTDVDTMQTRIVQAFVDEIPRYVGEFLRSSGKNTDDQCHEGVIALVFALLLVFDALDRVYVPAVFDTFLNSKCRSAFLQGLVPHILSDKLRSLPVEVVQALVEHYASVGELYTIEKCVLHMDVASLDLNQVASLCKRHGMFSALAHVFTTALNDFITPIEAMFQASLAPEFGDKVRVRQLLLFVHETIQGKRFPIGDASLPNHILNRFRIDVMKFMLEPLELAAFATAASKATVSKALDGWKVAMSLLAQASSSTQLPPLRLLYLFLAEPKAASIVMMEFLKDWDAAESEILGTARQESERMASQIIAEAAVLAASACGEAGHSSSRSALLTFTARIVGGGRASVSQEIEQELLEELALAKTKHDALRREDAMVSIIARRIDEDIVLSDETRVLRLARDAHFAQAEAIVHIASGDHINALKALAGDVHRPNAAVHYIDVLFGKVAPGTVQSEIANAGPAVARAHPLDAAAAKTFQEELLAIMSAIASTSADVCARIAIKYFPHAQNEVLSALSSEPVLQFQYLRQVLEALHENNASSAMSNLSLAELVSSTKSIVTEEMSELYFRLMCQFEPQDVLKYLQSDSAHHLDRMRCLEYCRKFNVPEATAYLLEAAGQYEEALAIHLSNYCTGVRAMAQLSTNGGVTWTISAPVESLMRGLIIEANVSLRTAIDLCRRVSREVLNMEEMWWSCLDSIVRSMMEMREDTYNRVRDELNKHLEEVLRTMLGRVDNGQLLEMIVRRYGGEDISEIRKLLSRVFGNCASERAFLKAEGTVLKETIDKKLRESDAIRRRAQRGTRKHVTFHS